MPKDNLPIISLFCGAGGLDLGFRKAGYRAITAFDNLPAAVKTYNLNSKRQVAQQIDLAKVTPSEFLAIIEEHTGGIHPVGLVGGPPCQGFSRGNIRKKPDDPRNGLLATYAELLESLKLAYDIDFFAFENVLGLATPLYRARFTELKEQFGRAGFDVFASQLNARQFGVAQNRPRLFVVGINKKHQCSEFVFPTGSDRIITVREALRGLPDPVFYSRHLRWEDIPFHQNHWTMVPKSDKFKKKFQSKSRSFRRLEWNEVSPLIAYGNREIHVHPSGNRRLSVLEAMLLQGFPQGYRLIGTLSDQITQVSNAVPPPVAQALATQIRKTLRHASRNDARPCFLRGKSHGKG